VQEAENFTVFVKNSIAFPHFGLEFRKNNLLGNFYENISLLYALLIWKFLLHVSEKKTAFYDPIKNPLGQIFR
jgi:ATP P2X receptor